MAGLGIVVAENRGLLSSFLIVQVKHRILLFQLMTRN